MSDWKNEACFGRRLKTIIDTEKLNCMSFIKNLAQGLIIDLRYFLVLNVP